MKGAGALIIALNIAYDEENERGFVSTNLLALAIAVGAVLLALLAMTSVGALGHLDNLFPGAPAFLLIIGKIASYLLMAAAGAAAAASLYRFAPDRDGARWTWLTPGSVLVSALWLLVIGFRLYVANFANYGATYCSLSAVIVLLTWLYLSAYIFCSAPSSIPNSNARPQRIQRKGRSSP
jgi:membrane protein